MELQPRKISVPLKKQGYNLMSFVISNLENAPVLAYSKEYSRVSNLLLELTLENNSISTWSRKMIRNRKYF